MFACQSGAKQGVQEKNRTACITIAKLQASFNNSEKATCKELSSNDQAAYDNACCNDIVSSIVISKSHDLRLITDGGVAADRAQLESVQEHLDVVKAKNSDWQEQISEINQQLKIHQY